MKALTPQARAFVNRFQGGFPIAGRPFHGVAANLGMPETVLIQTVRQLLDEGLLSRFGPLYDATRLGGAVTLAALSVPEGAYEQVAQVVNRMPAVAHNYRREHALNMWFVVASDRPEGIGECLDAIRAETGLRVYDFPKRREFYLGLWLDIDGQGRASTVPVPAALQVPGVAATPGDFAVTADLQRLVAATQAGLPPVAEPYAEVATQLGLPVDAVMNDIRRMLSAGVIRRIGAVPNHYRLGLRGNGMTVWDVPDDQVAALGARIGALDFVSHCYERPRHARVWPYNLFAMVHGRDRAEVRAKTLRLREVLGDRVRAHDVLFSSAVLKKTGLRVAA
jgi:DNA-binding Lrp family transcriptional regulator